MSEDRAGRAGMTEGHRDPWSGPWSCPAEREPYNGLPVRSDLTADERRELLEAAADEFNRRVSEKYAEFNTVEADPWEQLDQLREQLGSARAWAVALEQRVEAVRSWFYSANQYTSLLDVLDAPLEVERP